MKKFLTLSFAALLVCTAAAIAQQSASPSNDQSSQSSAQSIRGTISSVDNNAKTLTVKDSTGKDVTIYWNDTTRFSGGSFSDLKEGSAVTIQATDQSGRMVASSITLSSKKSY